MSVARVMPKQKPGKSEQTVGTPRDLLDAIVERYGPIGFDLAATKQDSVIPSPDGNDHFGPGSTLATNALFADWSCISDGILWLNPPFRRIEPWAKKCAQYSDERIALLVPLSTADWALKHVYPFARVLGLFPRVTFAGHKSPYPKDMMLAMYGTGFVPGFETWRWKS